MANKDAATKSKAAPITLAARDGETRKQAIARFAMGPTTLAACLLVDLHTNMPDTDIAAFIAELDKQVQAANNGNLQRSDAMLVAQSHTLDAIFYSLIGRSRANSAEGYLQAAEIYMRLALRAQSQCRATVETLAAIKNPAPVAFVRQANIAAGPQQVNNAPMPAVTPSRAGNSENPPNKLSEASNELPTDARTSAVAGSVDPQLEAMGTVDGAENVSR